MNDTHGSRTSRLFAAAAGVVTFGIGLIVIRLPGAGGPILSAGAGLVVAVAAGRSRRVGRLARFVLGLLASVIALIVVLWTMLAAGATAQGCGLDTCDPHTGSLPEGLGVAVVGGAVSSAATWLAAYLLVVRPRRRVAVTVVVGTAAAVVGAVLALVGAGVATRSLN